MRAACDALAELPATPARALLGGDGRDRRRAAEHRAIARAAERLGIEVIAVGTDLYGIEPVDDPAAAIGPLAGGDAHLLRGSDRVLQIRARCRGGSIDALQGRP